MDDVRCKMYLSTVNCQLSISYAEVWARLGIVQTSLTLLSLLQTLSTYFFFFFLKFS